MPQYCLWSDAAQSGKTAAGPIIAKTAAGPIKTAMPSILSNGWGAQIWRRGWGAHIHRVEPSGEVEHVAVVGSRLHVVSAVLEAQIRLTTRLACLLRRSSKQSQLRLFHLIVDNSAGVLGGLGRKDLQEVLGAVARCILQHSEDVPLSVIRFRCRRNH